MDRHSDADDMIEGKTPDQDLRQGRAGAHPAFL